jgi:hypothetical protein
MGWKRMALLVALVSTGGCYEYHTVRPDDAVLDTRVRATVSPEKAAELEPVLRNVTPTVTGKLIERTPDHLLLEVPIYGAGGGVSNEVLHNRVEVDVGDLVSLQTRTLSTWRTLVAVGAVVAAAGGTYAVLDANNQSGPDKPGSDVNNAVVSIFRIPLGIFR